MTILSRSRRRAGFTLVELMISVAVMGIVVMYLMQSFTTQHRTYVVMDQVTEAQQNSRAIADLLEREVRTAGFLVPEHAAVCGVDRTNGSDTLYVSDAEALDPTNQTNANLGARILLGLGGAGTQILNLNDVTLDGQSFYDTDGNGVPDSDFRCDTGTCTAAGRAAGGVIVVDAANPRRGTACGTIQRIPGGNSVQVNMVNALSAVPAGGNTPDLRAVPAHVYAVNANRELLRDNLVLASDVDDLQVAFFYDVDEDRVIDGLAVEYPGSAGGLVYQPENWDGTTLREVRINFVVRTRDDDDRLSEGQFQVTENRVAGAAPADGFRRRVHTATVRLRNVGTRG